MIGAETGLSCQIVESDFVSQRRLDIVDYPAAAALDRATETRRAKASDRLYSCPEDAPRAQLEFLPRTARRSTGVGDRADPEAASRCGRRKSTRLNSSHQ